MRLILVLALIFLAGCTQVEAVPEPSPIVASVPVAAMPSPSPSPSPSPEPLSEIEMKITDLSLEEKIGKLFILAFRGEKNISLNSDISDALEKYKPTGVILFAENIAGGEQLIQFITDMKDACDYGLIVCIDEEGGRVSRLKKLDIISLLPASETKTADEAYARGQALAEALKLYGFDMNFAPVADLNTNPANTVIGNRAFGSEPDTASEMVAAAVRGLEASGIRSVIKHFPGHGDTAQDSHYGTATARHSLERLMEVELVPFQAGIDAGATGVMIGHITVPEIDNQYPATFSKKLVTEILRGEMGFDGLVLTDAMDMGAVTEHYTAAEAAVLALEAGVDIILMPQDIAAAYEAVLDACESGRITEERIDESVRRVLEVTN